MDAKKKSALRWPRVISVGNAKVKIYRNAEPTNAKGVAYILAWKGAEGRQRQKFSSEADAVTEARVKCAQINAGRIEGAEMTRGDRDELQSARALTQGMPRLSVLSEWAKARQLTAGNMIAACEAYFRALPANFAGAQRASAAFFAASLRFFAQTPFHRDLPAFAC